jgi:dTDP-glucose 4,6-dehydratase
MNWMITGGAGFIGSHFVDLRLKKYPRDFVLVVDKLTYAGNPANLAHARGYKNYKFVQADICDGKTMQRLVKLHQIDGLVNFAAETHVDRSILRPDDFIRTDVLGTQVLLEIVRSFKLKTYLQISTDEVYGSILKGAFSETHPIRASSPYSASKASGDLMVLAYRHTYQLPVMIARSSNNFGPRQYPEKLIPLFITHAMDNLNLPLYGDGLNMRDWIYVEDNCLGLDWILQQGRPGEIYNVGGGNLRTNREITELILNTLHRPKSLIHYVQDRPGHDRRYALNSSKLKKLGWKPSWSFTKAMAHTITWYQKNTDWWRAIKSGEYLKYYKEQYRR